MTTGDHARLITERLFDTSDEAVAREAAQTGTELLDSAIQAVGGVIPGIFADGLAPEDCEAAMDWAVRGAQAFISLAVRFSHASDPCVTVGPPTEVPDR